MRNPDHLRIAAKSLRDHVHQRLEGQGYTADEIELAASGRTTDTRIKFTEDGETPTPESWCIGALMEIRLCEKALQRGDIDNAAAHLGEAREYRSLAQINRDGPDTARGRGTQRSASKGHAVVHGTTEEKEARWSDLQARVEAKLADNPKLSLTEARRRVSNDTGWSYTTVRRHTAR